MKLLKYVLGIFMLLSFVFIANAQELTQTIRGQVINAESQTSVAFASIAIVTTNPPLGTTTDDNGNFCLSKVPIGRHNLQVSFIGYETQLISEIMVTSGKEIVLTIKLKEQISKLDEVTINAYSRKDKPINSMATISSRTFSVEETSRYAGGLDDPARLASSFAGVTAASTSSNAIIIRGNSPRGVLWRFEGVDIPAAFHFPSADVIGGGGITVLSSQMLSNSDFYTGAFPSEFGNTTSGVFDIKLRTGNSEKREYTAQISTIGIDISAEGPIIKGKAATYLFNYRYSTLALLRPILPHLPKYKDLCFKFNFPTIKYGTFSLWGLGAVDKTIMKAETDSLEWKSDQDKTQFEYHNTFGTMGLSHKIIFGTKCYVQSLLAGTAMDNTIDTRMINNSLTLVPTNYIDGTEGRYTFRSVINYKFNTIISNRSGIIFNHLFYNALVKSSLPNHPETFQTYVDNTGTGILVQVFSQTKIQLTPNLSTVLGLHSMRLDINKKTTLEPRVSLNCEFSENDELGFAYGLHSQMEELRTYFSRINTNGNILLANKNLDFMKVHHFVLGFNHRINDVLRLKIEPYYQYITQVPVIPDSSFSIINLIRNWAINSKLENSGTGFNYGIDITLERFLNNNYYYLFTASVFSSKYKGGDGVIYNTRFNRNFVVNLLFGKEFQIGRQSKNNLLGLNGKIAYMGGMRYIPAKEIESLAANEYIGDYSHSFEKHFPNSFTFDVSISYRTNKKNYSGVWSVMVKNALITPDYYDPVYDSVKKKITIDELSVIIPAIGYKIEF